MPANVSITTKNGPVRVNLPSSADPNFGNVAGFQLGGDLAAIAPDPAAPITIDGGANVSGIGIGVSPGSGRAPVWPTSPSRTPGATASPSPMARCSSGRVSA